MAVPHPVDSLPKVVFERLANHLLWAEFSGRGSYWPNPTGEGSTDGGWDGLFDGEYDGRRERWRVSVKHTTGADPVRSLQAALRPDLQRYKHAEPAWLFVTNAVLEPPQQERLRKWLSTRARASALIDGQAVRLLLDRHPAVGRMFGLPTGQGHVIGEPPEQEPIPESWEEVVDQVLGRLDKHQLVAIEGPAGIGQELALRRACVRAREWTGAALPLPLWVDVPVESLLPALDAEARAELSDRGGYLFVVPKNARQVLPHLLPLLGRNPADRLIAAVDDGESLPGAVRVKLPVPSDGELLRWLERAAPTAALERRSEMARIGNGRPGVILDWWRHKFDAVCQSTRAVLERAKALERLDAREVLALIMLDLPQRQEAFDAEWIATTTGSTTHEVHRVVELAIELGLISVADDVRVEAAPLFTAAVLDQCRLSRPTQRRLAERPELAVRYAGLGQSDEPLRKVLTDDLERVRRGDYVAANTALRRASEIPVLSEAAAALALEVARAAIRRAGSADPFPADSLVVTSLRESGGRHLRFGAADVLARLAWNASVMPAALQEGLGLARAGETARLKEIARNAFSARHPERQHPASAFRALLDDRTLDPPWVEVAAVAAEIWLSSVVETRASVGHTFTWGHATWNEGNPDVQARRRDAFELLWRLLRADEPSIRSRGWMAWDGVWNGPSPGERPDMPPTLVEEIHRAIDFARERIATAPWDERVVIEQMVLRFVRAPEVDRDRLATAIEAFPTEPLYQAWRLIVDRTWFLVDPAATATDVRRGEAWETFASRTMPTAWHASTPERVAERLATLDASAVFQLLDRVAEHAHRFSGALDVLSAWMSRSPEVFEPILFGTYWDRVPPTLRAMVLRAAREPFGQRLAEGLTISGARLGAAVTLAQLMSRPETFEADEVVTQLPALWAVVAHANRAAALHRIAAHPAIGARVAVATQLSEWIQYGDIPPDERDARAIIRALIGSGLPSEENARVVHALLRGVSMTGANRRGLFLAALGGVGDLLLPMLEHVDQLDVDVDVVAPLVARIWEKHGEAWLARVRAARWASSALVPARLPTTVAVPALQSLLDSPPDDADRVYRRLVASLGDTDVAALIHANIGSTERLRALLAAYKPAGTPQFLEALDAALATFDEETARAVAMDVAGRVLDGTNPEALGRAFAEVVRVAARKSPTSRLDLVADAIDSVLRLFTVGRPYRA